MAKIPNPAAQYPSAPQKPDQIKLTPMAAERLGALSNLNARELAGMTIAEIGDKYRNLIDSQLLLSRTVRGVVVKKDPVTGIERPVPYATVHVEDTDCSLLGYFPTSSRWAWYFPFRCRREVIATARTNACGRFSVSIPRWDIDWVLRFRRDRVCFPSIFERPSIRDILEGLIPVKIPGPIPEDPLAGMRIDRGRFIRMVEDVLGRETAHSLDRLQAQATFGASNVMLNTLLDENALAQQLSPPLPAKFPTEGLRLGIEDTRKVDPRRYIGPFKRCVDVVVPEWTPILDVPDITFRVTQDTNGDGVEEEIYAEGHFQVRWDAPSLGTIKIVAKANALSSAICDAPDVECENKPAIVMAGRMPVIKVPDLYDTANGYALRPNRPHPNGTFVDPAPHPDAASPFHGTIALWGCKNTDPAATHYRIQFKFSADNGATFTPHTPFVGLSWPLFRLTGGTAEWHYPTADANGWYPIHLPAGNDWLPSENLLLDWPTQAFANGRYLLKLELGTPAGGVTSDSGEVAFNVDNSAPQGLLSVEWRKLGGGAFQPLLLPCPLVRRGASPVDLEFRVTLAATARHLRSATLGAGGCGAGEYQLVSGKTEHWHTSPANNSESLQAIYRLPASASEGTYSFGGKVSGRAFNPNGGDGGHLPSVNWEYDPDDSHVYPYFAFSVINTDS